MKSKIINRVRERQKRERAFRFRERRLACDLEMIDETIARWGDLGLADADLSPAAKACILNSQEPRKQKRRWWQFWK